MNYMTQMMIAWAMFKDWMKETFGSGIEFTTPVSFPTAPGYVEGYSK